MLDPVTAVALGLKLLDEAISLVNHLKSQAGMSADDLLSRSDAGDLVNKESIKGLLAGG